MKGLLEYFQILYLLIFSWRWKAVWKCQIGRVDLVSRRKEAVVPNPRDTPLYLFWETHLRESQGEAVLLGAMVLLGYSCFLKAYPNASNSASFPPMSCVYIHGGRCVKYNRKTTSIRIRWTMWRDRECCQQVFLSSKEILAFVKWRQWDLWNFTVMLMDTWENDNAKKLTPILNKDRVLLGKHHGHNSKYFARNNFVTNFCQLKAFLISCCLCSFFFWWFVFFGIVCVWWELSFVSMLDWYWLIGPWY